MRLKEVLGEFPVGIARGRVGTRRIYGIVRKKAPALFPSSPSRIHFYSQPWKRGSFPDQGRRKNSLGMRVGIVEFYFRTGFCSLVCCSRDLSGIKKKKRNKNKKEQNKT